MSNSTWRQIGRSFGGDHSKGQKTTSVSRTEAMASLGSVVYAARLGDGTIKIGWTEDFADRLRYLSSRTKQDVELLAFRPGNHTDEQEIHRSLRDHLTHGREWYNPTPAVMEVVNEMRNALGMDPIAA